MFSKICHLGIWYFTEKALIQNLGSSWQQYLDMLNWLQSSITLIYQDIFNLFGKTFSHDCKTENFYPVWHILINKYAWSLDTHARISGPNKTLTQVMVYTELFHSSDWKCWNQISVMQGGSKISVHMRK